MHYETLFCKMRTRAQPLVVLPKVAEKENSTLENIQWTWVQLMYESYDIPALLTTVRTIQNSSGLEGINPVWILPALPRLQTLLLSTLLCSWTVCRLYKALHFTRAVLCAAVVRCVQPHLELYSGVDCLCLWFRRHCATALEPLHLR